MADVVRIKKRCAECGNEFEPSRKSHKFCSSKCTHKNSYRNINPLKNIICKTCGEEFTPIRNSQMFCSEKCGHKIWGKTYRSKEKYKDVKRNCYYKRMYGITLEEYRDMKAIQNNSCAICHTHQDELAYPLNVDHDHSTEEIRGLLCSFCNTMIGIFDDDPENIEQILLNAKAYLRGK